MDGERDGPAELDRYLDGLLSPEESERFERTLERSPELAAEAALQGRVDAFLERRFAPPRDLVDAAARAEEPAALGPRPLAGAPAGPIGGPIGGPAGGPAGGLIGGGRGTGSFVAGASAERPLAGPGAGGSPAGPGRRGWLAAAAAVLVGLALGLVLQRDGAPTPDGGRAPLQTAGTPALPGDRPAAGAAPESRTLAEPGGLTPRSAPDLAALYASLSEARVPSGVPSRWGELVALPDASGIGGAAAGGSLESRLAARYDECLDLSAPACIVLGPYAVPEWPSATVLVGFCGGGAPTLLVVDDQTMTGCALTPRTGALSPFYKEVSGLAVWEVTEGDHPVLLDGVRACAD